MSRVVENTSPNGWDLVRLEELSNISIGKTPPRSKKELFLGNNIWLSIRDLKGDVVSVSNEKITDEAVKSSNMKIISEGTLLMSFKLTLGKTSFAGCDLYTNEAIASLPIKDETVLNKYFLKYALATIDLEKEVDNAVKGKTLNKQKLKNLEIPLPPLKEQECIVAKIDTLFAKIDKAISLSEESLKQAKNLLPSSVKKLFEDGETKGWKKLKFKDFASLRHGHQFRKYDYVENGIPVIKIGQCIPGDRLDLTKCNFIDKSRETEFSNDLICKGDLLMALTGGTLGKVTWVKDDYGVVVQNYRVGNFFTDEKLCSKRFLMYALLSPIFQTLMYSKINVAAQPNIGKEEIENLEFILPSLEEQLKVVDRLDDLTFKVKHTQSKLEEQLAYLKQLKSSILSKAFKGEL